MAQCWADGCTVENSKQETCCSSSIREAEEDEPLSLSNDRGAHRLVMNAALADLLEPYCGFILSPVDSCYFV